MQTERLNIIETESRAIKADLQQLPDFNGTRKSEAITMCEAILDRVCGLRKECETIFRKEIHEQFE
jgi:hypothetical protein